MKAFIVIGLFATFLMGGVLKIDNRCPKPTILKIHISTIDGKVVYDKSLKNPQDNSLIDIFLDKSLKYNYTITTDIPALKCYIKDAKGDILPSKIDINCDCLLKNSDQNATTSSKINIKPGLWKFVSKSAPMPFINRVDTKCIKDPQKELNVHLLAAIDDANCPFIYIKQEFKTAKWKRTGPICGTITGNVKYLDTKLKERIKYEDRGNFTLFIDGERLGECKKKK